MAESGLKTIERWATAAIFAAALLFAHVPPVAASAGVRPPAGPLSATFLIARPTLGSHRTPGFWLAELNFPEERLRAVDPSVPAPRGSSRRRFPMPPLAAGYQPVSGDARRAPPTSGDEVFMRAGSIRDAVTRYNEERDSGRVLPRTPNTDARPPDTNLYHN